MTLKSLFEKVVVNDDIQNRAGGYYIKVQVLLRQWSPHTNCYVSDPVVQVVVPMKLHPLVLKTGYFYWPPVKKDVASFIKTCNTSSDRQAKSGFKICGYYRPSANPSGNQ